MSNYTLQIKRNEDVASSKTAAQTVLEENLKTASVGEPLMSRYQDGSKVGILLGFSNGDGQNYSIIDLGDIDGVPYALSTDIPTNVSQLTNDKGYRTSGEVQTQITNYAPSKSGSGANGTWNINVMGNAGTASALQTARTINGTSFNGSANITTAKWGSGRTITVSDHDGSHTGTGVTVDGSANVTLKLPSTITADLNGTANRATADASGNNISNTYATKAELNSNINDHEHELADITNLNSGWGALLSGAPSSYVTRWPSISEVTNKQELVVKLNGGTTEGTNQFTYSGTTAKTINVTPASIGAAASSHSHTIGNVSGLQDALDGKQPTGNYALKSEIPTKVSQLNNDSNYQTSSQVSTTVNNAISNLISGAPEALDTLNELAAALGDDPNFATTISAEIGTKVDKVDGKGLSENDFTDELLAKLNSIASGATKVTVDSALNTNSTNPVQNKVVTNALNGKANASHTHEIADVDGLQTALDNKQPVGNYATSAELTSGLAGKANTSHTHPGSQVTGLTANRVLVASTGGTVSVSPITPTELGYLDGVTGNVQTQLNNKAASNHNHNASYVSALGTSGNTVTWTKNGQTSAITVPFATSATNASHASNADQATNATNATTASKVGQSFTIKVNTPTATTEGTNTYTFNGSSSKTLDIKQGSNVTLTAGQGTLTIAAKDTTYTAGTGLKLSSGQFAINTNGNSGQFLNGNGTWSTPANTTYTAGTGIALSGTQFNLKQATSDEIGGIKIGYTESGKTYPVELNSEGKAFVNVPWVNTTYSVATQSTNGLMSSGDKTKLDGIATGATRVIVDTGITSGGTNPVQGKAIYNALAGKSNTGHTHTIGQVSNLQSTLDEKSNVGHTHTVSQITDANTLFSAFSANGSQTRITIGGTTKDLTIPYATSAITLSTSALTTQHLSGVTTEGHLYFGGGANTVSGKPDNVDGFGMLTLRTASGWVGQLLMASNTAQNIYWRTATTTAMTNSWRTLVDSTNYTNYTVTKTGSGASGTWGINISGTATKATQDGSGRTITSTYALKNEIPSVPTKVSQLENDSHYATTGDVDTRIKNIIGAAPEELDTLEELASALTDNEDAVVAINATLATKADKSEIPTKLPNPQSLTIQLNGASQGAYDGSSAKTVNITASAIGAATSSHSHSVATASQLGMVKLGSDTTQTASTASLSTAAGKTYLVQNNANDQLVVNVPWTDTKYTLPTASSSTKGGFKTGFVEGNKNYAVKMSGETAYVSVPWTDTNTTYGAATSTNLGLVKVGYPESGKTYPVELDSNNRMFVNVPWTDTDTKYTLPTASNSTKGGFKTGFVESGKNYAVKMSGETAYVSVPWTDTHVTVDSALSSTSTNPVQNKVINTALAGKLSTGGTAANASKVANSLTIQGNGTGISFNGSASRTVNIVPGTNINVVGTTGGTITISCTVEKDTALTEDDINSVING